MSYGSAGGICTGGPSCGNHCSVGCWARAIRPPASHQLSSLPSVCVTHLYRPPDHRHVAPKRFSIAGELHTWYHNEFVVKYISVYSRKSSYKLYPQTEVLSLKVKHKYFASPVIGIYCNSNIRRGKEGVGLSQLTHVHTVCTHTSCR